jgi:hypothetical protein
MATSNNHIDNFPVAFGHFILNSVPQVDGFAATDAIPGEKAKIIQKTIITSETPIFYKSIDGVVSTFLGRLTMPQMINNFVIVVHSDLSADVYLNSIPITALIIAKHDIDMLSPVPKSAIADITDMHFKELDTSSDDQIYICLKVG